jgi:hypothetical protein
VSKRKLEVLGVSVATSRSIPLRKRKLDIFELPHGVAGAIRGVVGGDRGGNQEIQRVGSEVSWITSVMPIRFQLLAFWMKRNPRTHCCQRNRRKPKFLLRSPKLPLKVVPKKEPRRTLPQFQSSFGITRWDSIEVARVNIRTSRKSRFARPFCSSETACTPDGARRWQ